MFCLPGSSSMVCVLQPLQLLATCLVKAHTQSNFSLQH
jgi:hypothetical protein